MSILTALCSLVQNKLSELHISRISDLEIEIIVRHEHDSATSVFDRGNFIRDKQILREDITVGVVDQRALENLWCLHAEKLMPIHRLFHHKIGIGALERIGNSFSSGGRTAFLSFGKNLLDNLRCNKRTRGVMHRDVLRFRAELKQTSRDGILPMLATGDDRSNFPEIFPVRDFSNFGVSIFTRDDYDLANGTSALERSDRMRDNGFAGNFGKKFVETHATAAPRRDDDGG